MSADKAEKRRAQILEASLDVFAEKGYHAAKISDIAQKLGMGHGTFYRYFRNKLDIFYSIVEDIIIKMERVVADEDPGSTNTLEEYREQIHRIAVGLHNLFREDIRMARILFYEALGVDEGLNDRIDQVMDAVGLYIELYLKNGIEKGFLKPDLDTKTLCRGINALMFAGAKDVMSAPEEEQEETVRRWARATSLLMLDGMGNRQTP